MANVVKCRVVFGSFVPPEQFSFDFWVPRPPNLLSQYQSTFRDLTEALGEKSAAHLDEIEWMRREWGTSGDGWEFKGSRQPAGYALDFNAAWSAPLPVFLAMAKRDGPLKAYWYEEFGHHAGHLRFEADKDQNGLVVATEVVKVYRGGLLDALEGVRGGAALAARGGLLLGYRGIRRIVVGERFVPGAVDGKASSQSVDAYLTELRGALWGADSEVPLIRGDFDE